MTDEQVKALCDDDLQILAARLGAEMAERIAANTIDPDRGPAVSPPPPLGPAAP